MLVQGVILSFDDVEICKCRVSLLSSGYSRVLVFMDKNGDNKFLNLNFLYCKIFLSGSNVSIFKIFLLKFQVQYFIVFDKKYRQNRQKVGVEMKRIEIYSKEVCFVLDDIIFVIYLIFIIFCSRVFDWKQFFIDVVGIFGW